MPNANGDDRRAAEPARDGQPDEGSPSLDAIPPFPGVQVEICTGPPHLDHHAAAALLQVLLRAHRTDQQRPQSDRATTTD